MMTSDSNTPFAIDLRVDALRIVLWIAVHVLRSAWHTLRAVIRSVPRPSMLQKLLVAFSLHWNRDDSEESHSRMSTLNRPRSRPRSPSSASGPTYLRSVSGRLQLWLGLRSDHDHSSGGVQLLLDTVMHQNESYWTINCDDDDDKTAQTGDRDDLRCVLPNARLLLAVLLLRTLTRCSSRTQTTSDLETHHQPPDITPPAAFLPVSALEAMSAQSPPLLMQDQSTDSLGPGTRTRKRDHARHTVIDQRKNSTDQ